MKLKVLLVLLATIGTASVSSGSILSKAFSNSARTVEKAAKDTAAEVSRAQEKIAQSGIAGPSATILVPKAVADQQVAAIGVTLNKQINEKERAEKENTYVVTGLFTVTGALITALFALGSNGILGRYGRRKEYIGSVLGELDLEERYFDFARVPKYRRLCKVLPMQSSRDEPTK